ncbi:retrovirus-related pol polyprotein from transposon RE2 [Citrus sinensis]|nr:retrovirus-related pol polyprotein from transposon RE2 [Citrus sinensis]
MMEDQTQTKTKDKEASGSGLGKTMMSPYFLLANDNPGTIITQVQLRGTNYDEWARAMRTALRAKKKFGFVDGTVKQPADDSADLEDWWMVNSMLVSWIHNTIKSNLQSTVTYTGVAKLLWDDIKERFSVRNGLRVQQLKSELANCKQRGAEWDKKQDEEKLHQFLMGLDEVVYGGVRSHILSTEPLPKLNRAYAIVIQEEQLIGYPEWWGERPKAMRNVSRGRGNSRQNSGNNGCGRGNSRQNGGNNGRGHGGPARGNAAQVATRSNNLSGELPKSAASDLSGLSSEQWNTLLNLLNSKKDNTSRISGKRNSMEWILNTGASHHMTGNRKILRDIVSVIPCSIQLPDGKATIANTEGTVVLASHLQLNNVLFMPSISVSQLIRDANCFIQFSDQLCVIQDRITRMLIGAGEQQEGLYYFRDIGSVATLSSVANRACDLLHRKLGHHSSKGPYRTASSCGAHYFLTIVDDFSRGVWTYLLVAKNETPYERLFGKAPSYTNIRSFCCLAYAYNHDHCSDKFASQSRRCMFMGYPFGKKGWGSIEAVVTSLQQQPVLGRHLRQRQQSIKLKDYVLYTVQHLSPSSRPSSCSRAQSLHAAITVGVKPASFAEAVRDPRWREAMKSKLQALENNNTWIVVSLPPRKRAIGFQTFLVVAAAKNWELHQMDVYNAFLHGELNEEVYMRLPPAALKTYGFAQSSSNYSLFTFHRDNIQLLVLVYVDDIIVSGNNSEAIRVVKMYLSDCFYMKDLGPLKYFLDIEVARNQTEIFMSQRKYVLDIISEAGLLGAKPAPFPLELNHQLALAKGPYFSDPAKYRRLPRERHWEAALRVVRYLKVTCELKWLKGLLMSLRVDHSRPMHLYCDSQAALHLAANPVFHERTKHIEVDCHFVRDKIQRRNIRPAYVSTNI